MITQQPQTGLISRFYRQVENWLKNLISEELRVFPDHWYFPSGIVQNWIDNTFQKRSFQFKIISPFKLSESTE